MMIMIIIIMILIIVKTKFVFYWQCANYTWNSGWRHPAV